MIFWTMMLVGCSEFGFDPIDPDDAPRELVVVEERFVQAPLPATDLLFVVDQTQSMEQEHAALLGGVEPLVATLDEVGVAWQIGVVSTSLGPFQEGLLQGQPWVLTPSEPDPVGWFAERLRVDVLGVPGEAGLYAGVLALQLAEPGEGNAGFRRPGAGLEVVFVSDADDLSDRLLDDPVEAFLDQLSAEATEGTVHASALVGDLPSGCTSVRGTARPGVRYVEVAEATGGTVASICDADFGEVLGALGRASIELPARFPLAEEPATVDLVVEVDGDPVEGWSLEEAPAAVVFDEPPPAGALITISYIVENR